MVIKKKFAVSTKSVRVHATIFTKACTRTQMNLRALETQDQTGKYRTGRLRGRIWFASSRKSCRFEQVKCVRLKNNVHASGIRQENGV